MIKRNHTIDLLKLIAIVGVVVVHTTSLYPYEAIPYTLDFYILHSINQLARFAVPLFFTISGFVLGLKYANLPRSKTLKFYEKRIKRVFIPYFVWTLIYFLIVFPRPASLLISWDFVNLVVRGSASAQLYFIPAIMGLYMIFPLIIKYQSVVLSTKFMVLWSIIVCEALILAYFFNTILFYKIGITFMFYNSWNFLVGIYCAIKIKNIYQILQRLFWIIWIVVIASYVIMLIESISLFSKTENILYFTSQWRPSIMLYAIGVGSLLYYYLEKNKNRALLWLSEFSFGVFFVHIIILRILFRQLDKFRDYDLISFVIATVLTLILSFAFSILLSKNKILNKLLGLRG